MTPGHQSPRRHFLGDVQGADSWTFPAPVQGAGFERPMGPKKFSPRCPIGFAKVPQVSLQVSLAKDFFSQVTGFPWVVEAQASFGSPGQESAEDTAPEVAMAEALGYSCFMSRFLGGAC